MSKPFNPLDMHNLGLSMTTAMHDSQATPLGGPRSFYGAGVYAIYYTGDFDPYRLLALHNRNDRFESPIYVGKAIPKGGRKGGMIDPEQPAPKTRALADRLRKHASSISYAENLDIEDFYCRWLVVEPIWIPLGENVMISRSMPVWNNVVDGFGSHDPGAGRREGMVPRWDVLHPGRPWAPLFQPRDESADDIAADATEYLRSRLPQV